MRAGTVLLCSLAGVLACGRSNPASPPRTLKTFAASERPIVGGGVTADDGGWRIEAPAAGTLRLYEVTDPGVEQSILYYRARLRTADVQGRAFLEMWVRLPGQGEYFSRGLAQTVSGTTGWASYEIPFVLQKGQKPDLVKLNIVLEGGGGTIWVKDVELLATPMK
jgi:hypothetical protein